MIRLLDKFRLRRDADSGSALVVALVVVVAVGIMLAAVLDFAGTGLTSGIQLRNLRNVNYFSQGAVDGAANQIRGSSATGSVGKPCPDYVPPVPSGIDGATGHTYRVTCSPKSTPGGTGTDQPAYAVLALSSSSNEGIIATGNHSLTIDGGVYSNNEISMQHQTLVINGTGTSKGPCSPSSPADTGGTVTSTDPLGLHCSTGVAASDPDYKAGIASLAALDALITSGGSTPKADPTPTCTVPGVVKFLPGYYSEQPGVLLQQFASTCTGAQVWWFSPGQYFFNFSGTWQIGSPCSGGIPCANDVVGGDPTSPTTTPAGLTDWVNGSGTPESDWNATPLPKPACKNDVTSTTYGGVQFVFGGGSQLQTSSTGGIELCGPTSASSDTGMVPTQSDGTKQHIVLDFLKSGDPAPTVVLPKNTVPAITAPAASGSWTGVPDASTAAESADTNAATATLSKNQSVSMTYTKAFTDGDPGTSDTTKIPAGAKVQHAWVRVYQNLTSGSNPTSSSLKVTTTHSGATAQSFSVPGTCPGVQAGALPYCDVSIDSALKAPNWKDLGDGDGVTVEYTGNGPNGGGPGATGIVQLDAVALVVQYTYATDEPSTCTLANSCVGWNSSVNLDAFLHGTSYAPLAEMDVEVQGRSGTVFDRGVICATLHANIVASSIQTTSPFQLPSGTATGRLVLFTGYVDADMRVRACVFYQDYDYLADGTTKAAFPGFKMTVQSWNVFRGSPPTTPEPSC